jgi:hypothetical protein
MATEQKIRARIAATAQSALLTLLALSASASYSQTDVRDVDNAARQPFHAELRRLSVRTSGAPQSFQVAEVPFGKRLVIEHVTFRVRSLEATAQRSAQPRFAVAAALVTKVNGASADHELIVNRADIGGASFNVVSQPIRVYADPGSLVLVLVDGRFPINAGAPLEIIRLTVSGHLVDVP